MKTYKLQTLEEIVAIATPKNVECLAIDLGNWLRLKVGIKEITKHLPPEILEVQGSKTFNWIDDGKTDTNITIKVENK